MLIWNTHIQARRAGSGLASPGLADYQFCQYIPILCQRQQVRGGALAVGVFNAQPLVEVGIVRLSRNNLEIRDGQHRLFYLVYQCRVIIRFGYAPVIRYASNGQCGLTVANDQFTYVIDPLCKLREQRRFFPARLGRPLLADEHCRDHDNDRQ